MSSKYIYYIHIYLLHKVTIESTFRECAPRGPGSCNGLPLALATQKYIFTTQRHYIYILNKVTCRGAQGVATAFL
jgi:hypothetical protein